MTKLLEENKIKACELEIAKKETSYTINTLDYLVGQYPKDEFFWILGSDQLDVFHKYKEWELIVKNHSVIIFPRESVLFEMTDRVKKAFKLKSIQENIIIMDDEELILTNISSSLIRKRIKEGLSITHLVPENVEEYINKNKLYI